jgi:hypothetical protein
MTILPRAAYTAELDGDDVIVIIDHDDGSRSVTNDAENVVADIAARFDLRARRIVYRDSEGRWDGLVVECGRFAGFIMLGTDNREKAVSLARNRAIWRAAVR